MGEEKMKKTKFIIHFLSIFITIHAFSKQIKLSLDIEIKEPENIIFNRLIDIATDSKNYIYVLDSKEKTIYVFNEEGTFIKKKEALARVLGN
jgi:hypothetical protein